MNNNPLGSQGGRGDNEEEAEAGDGSWRPRAFTLTTSSVHPSPPPSSIDAIPGTPSPSPSPLSLKENTTTTTTSSSTSFAEQDTFYRMCIALLEPLLQAHRPAQKASIFQAYCRQLPFFAKKNTTRSGHTTQESFFPYLRLVLPHLDQTRSNYQLKEAKIAQVYREALALPPHSEAAQRLMQWKDPRRHAPSSLPSASSSALESGTTAFSDVVYAVLLNRGVAASIDEEEEVVGAPRRRLSIAGVNALLDQLAVLGTATALRSTPSASYIPPPLPSTAATTTSAAAQISNPQQQRLALFRDCLRRMTPVEHKWFVRLLLKDLKLGLNHLSVFKLIHPAAWDTYARTSSLERVCEEMSLHNHNGSKTNHNNNNNNNMGEEKEEELGTGGRVAVSPALPFRAEIEVSQPCRPMLAAHFSVKHLEALLEREGCVGVEPKYDGERILVHILKKQQEPPQQGRGPGSYTTQYWTRNGKDFTSVYAPTFDPILEAHLRHVAAAQEEKKKKKKEDNEEEGGGEEEGAEFFLDECILDGEMLVYDSVEEDFVPFGFTRTFSMSEEASRLAAYLASGGDIRHQGDISRYWFTFMVFDILHQNGVSIISQPLLARRRILAQQMGLRAFPTPEEDATRYDEEEFKRKKKGENHNPDDKYLSRHHLELVPSKTRRSLASVLKSLKHALMVEKREGVVLKAMKAPYLPGGRVPTHWMKLKHDHVSQLADTLDLVVVGAYWGTKFGRRQVTHFLLAAWREKPNGEKCDDGDTAAQAGPSSSPAGHQQQQQQDPSSSPSTFLSPFAERCIGEEERATNATKQQKKRSSTPTLCLHTLCKVGTGYTNEELQRVLSALEPHWENPYSRVLGKDASNPPPTHHHSMPEEKHPQEEEVEVEERSRSSAKSSVERHTRETSAGGNNNNNSISNSMVMMGGGDSVKGRMPHPDAAADGSKQWLPFSSPPPAPSAPLLCSSTTSSLPVHLHAPPWLDGWVPTQRELLPDLYISPKHSVVFEVFAYQFVTEDSRRRNFKAGFTLRFPRLLRVRWDKDVWDAATIEEVQAIRASSAIRLEEKLNAYLASPDLLETVWTSKKRERDRRRQHQGGGGEDGEDEEEDGPRRRRLDFLRPASQWNDGDNHDQSVFDKWRKRVPSSTAGSSGGGGADEILIASSSSLLETSSDLFTGCEVCVLSFRPPSLPSTNACRPPPPPSPGRVGEEHEKAHSASSLLATAANAVPSKTALESLLRRHGARVVSQPIPTTTTLLLAASREDLRVANWILYASSMEEEAKRHRQGNHNKKKRTSRRTTQEFLTTDVVRWDYILECLAQARLLPLHPRHVLYVSPSLREIFSQSYDQYEDAYFEDGTREELLHAMHLVRLQRCSSSFPRQEPPQGEVGLKEEEGKKQHHLSGCSTVRDFVKKWNKVWHMKQLLQRERFCNMSSLSDNKESRKAEAEKEEEVRGPCYLALPWSCFRSRLQSPTSSALAHDHQQQQHHDDSPADGPTTHSRDVDDASSLTHQLCVWEAREARRAVRVVWEEWEDNAAEAERKKYKLGNKTEDGNVVLSDKNTYTTEKNHDDGGSGGRDPAGRGGTAASYAPEPGPIAPPVKTAGFTQLFAATLPAAPPGEEEVSPTPLVFIGGDDDGDDDDAYTANSSSSRSKGEMREEDNVEQQQYGGGSVNDATSSPPESGTTTASPSASASPCSGGTDDLRIPILNAVPSSSSSPPTAKYILRIPVTTANNSNNNNNNSGISTVRGGGDEKEEEYILPLPDDALRWTSAQLSRLVLAACTEKHSAYYLYDENEEEHDEKEEEDFFGLRMFPTHIVDPLGHVYPIGRILGLPSSHTTTADPPPPRPFHI